MAAYFTRTGGSPVFSPSSVTHVTSNYLIKATDFYIGVNGTGITVTLPLGSTLNPGQMFVVKDESGLATPNSAYRFTIAGSGSNKIDGSPSVTVITSYTSLTFLWAGSFWSII